LIPVFLSLQYNFGCTIAVFVVVFIFEFDHIRVVGQTDGDGFSEFALTNAVYDKYVGNAQSNGIVQKTLKVEHLDAHNLSLVQSGMAVY
jgi:hypothetical protein